MRDLLRAMLQDPDPAPAGGAPPPDTIVTPPADGGAPPADAPPATPPADGGTPPAGDPPAGDPPAPADSWRSRMVTAAGFEGDAATKASGMLERVVDEGTLLKNYVEAQEKIRNGQISTGLGENPTPEQLTEYRAANDIPTEAGEYKVELAEGLVIGDNDKAILDEVYKMGHDGNVPNSVMSNMVNTFLAGREAELESIQQDDGIHKQQTDAKLTEAWGTDKVTNVNLVRGMFNGMPESIREDFLGARMADGRALFNSPEAMVYFGDIARKLNPAGTVVPNANNPVQAIGDEIKALEARMGEPGWHKDAEAQARYQSLIDAQNQMKEK